MVHVHHRADRGLIVTTSDFTPQACSLAAAQGIQLIDGQQLLDIVRRLANPGAKHLLGLDPHRPATPL